MAQLTTYRNLQVVSPDPTGSGGLAIQTNFITLAEEIAASRFVSGLKLRFVGPSQVEIGAGAAMSADGSQFIALPAAVTVDLATQGAGGLDTGSEAPDTIYTVWVIGDLTGTTAGLLSASATSPTLPNPLTSARRVGFVVNDGAGNLLPFHQSGNGPTRRILYAAGVAATRVLTSSVATAFATVDCSRYVPGSASLLRLHVDLDNTAPAGQAVDRRALLRAQGDTHDGSLYAFGTGTGLGEPAVGTVEVPCISGRIQARVADAQCSLSLSVVGCDDEL